MNERDAVAATEAVRHEAADQLLATSRHWSRLLDSAPTTPSAALDRVDATLAGDGPRAIDSSWAWTAVAPEAWWATPLGLVVAGSGQVVNGQRWTRFPHAQQMLRVGRATLNKRVRRGAYDTRPAPNGHGRLVDRVAVARESLGRYAPPPA